MGRGMSHEGGRPREDEAPRVTCVPIIFFWGLTAYFPWPERLFQVLCDHVRVLNGIDFSMNVGAFRTQGKG